MGAGNLLHVECDWTGYEIRHPPPLGGNGNKAIFISFFIVPMAITLKCQF